MSSALDSVEMLRMVSSGTEATMSVLRLARALTGRQRILEFEGCYHGHADALLVGAGSGVATLGIPGSPGVPPAFTELTIQAPYNDHEAVESAFARRDHGRGAQGLYGVQPDLTCLGKVVGGGLRAAAYGGPRELMERMAPVGPVYQAGTLSGNPLAVAAGSRRGRRKARSDGSGAIAVRGRPEDHLAL